MQQTLFNVIDTDKLTLDMFRAYYDARKNKRNTHNALAFEKHLEANVFALCEEVFNKTYEPRPSICFVVNKSTRTGCAPIKRINCAGCYWDF